ncbi:Hypothetical protein, putative [Bodo saltans]|uniref:Uncharacterized protein n=1 Tax=Bodo saltans TaxID=75058 RepID=A0A0S4J6I9_BODSA|nr:Hypothetical protein, putative [Bodo saltans]|eukprot:CUG84652.1 Hypothetical protein, putative [Bodo saltans]
MLRSTELLLRRGMPRPRAHTFPDKWRKVPASHKPMQGGQSMFNDFMLKAANDDLRLANAAEAGTAIGSGQTQATPLRLPQSDFASTRAALDQLHESEMAGLAESDAFVSKRAFNELDWYDGELAAQRAGATDAAVAPLEPDGTLLPDRVTDNEYFQSRFGYSLVKNTELAAHVTYKDLDLWAELPKYNNDMYFLYVISRRRNTYAVCFDFGGKRILKPYTVGNRGLKGGDRGFRAEGSTDNGHQVMSQYLADLVPLIREQRATAGKPLARGDKLDIVVRVMGFYNGRQGAVRAITDRNDLFNVRYFEDITPFPLNGPRMPRGVFK